MILRLIKLFLIFTVSISTICVGSSFAETLEESIAISSKENNSIKAAQAWQLSSAYEAKSDLIKVVAPRISVSGSYADVTNNDVTQSSSSFVSGKYTASSVSGKVEYTLFDGMYGLNRYKSKVSYTKAKKHQMHNTKQLIIRNTVERYIDYLRYKESVKVTKGEIEILKKKYNDMLIRMEHGDVTRTDVMQTEVNLKTSYIVLHDEKQSLIIALNRLRSIVTQDVTPDESLEVITKRVLAYTEKNFKNNFASLRSKVAQISVAHPKYQYRREIAAHNKDNLNMKYSLFSPNVTVSGFVGSNKYNGDLYNNNYSSTGVKLNLKYDILNFGSSYNEFKSSAKYQLKTLYDAKQELVNVNYDLISSIDNFKIKLDVLRLYREIYRSTDSMYQSSLKEVNEGGDGNFKILYYLDLLYAQKRKLIRGRHDVVISFYYILYNAGLLSSLENSVAPIKDNRYLLNDSNLGKKTSSII